MNENGRWITTRYGNKVFIKNKDVNEYMNDEIKKGAKKMTLDEYIAKKEQRQEPLLQEFGYKSKEEKFRYKAQRLLDKLKGKKE